jgi:[protein-PII] uridylyltransferase
MLKEFRAAREELYSRWLKREGGEVALRDHALLVDRYIIDCYRRCGDDRGKGQIALLALGGYGREELFPSSDIDLMILYSEEAEGRIEKITNGVLYPLWDTALEVGHGVRTVAQSLAHAEEDYFFLVALLDARLLYGSPELYAEMLDRYRTKFVDGHREDFVMTMKKFRESRRERFGSHSYLLEPHIKEGRGGMRDIQAMLWTARVVFGLSSLDDMEGAGLLLPEEKRDFVAARNLLVNLRGFLHAISRRKSDQLYFELQLEVAEKYGYKDKDGMLGVEHFMREVYSALLTISITTDLFFDHVDEVLGLAGRDKVPGDREIEPGIEIKGGRIHLTATREQLEAKPQLLLRIFLAMARSGLPMHHRSRHAVSAALDVMTPKVQASPRLAKTFFAILGEAKDLAGVLATMLETGVLTRCVPEFGRIVALAQHDLYHIYTVDRHSLQAVVELHELIERWHGIAQNVKKTKILYLAALLHDIGKGSGRDHSHVGAEMAIAIGERLCFTREECETLSFLIRYHLFIPENAMRRDLNDGVFITRCAETIGDVDRLSMLYLLSVADSRATGPSAWSEWKATLMEELYLKVYPYLDLGRHGVHDVLAHEEQGVAWLREQIDLLLVGESDLRIDPAALSTDYVLSFEPETVASHILTQRNHYARVRQRSLIVATEEEQSWKLLIMTVDRPGLLAKICGVMTLNNLSVVKAQIFTWADGTVVDVLDVRATDGLEFDERDWQDLNDQLDKAIEHRMGLGYRLYQKLSMGHGRKTQMVGEVFSKVVIDNTSSDTYTVIEVYSADVPGQLYYIAQAMADFGINIHKAYIATEVEQLIDAFYVQDNRGQKLLDEDFRAEVTQGILYAINRSST